MRDKILKELGKVKEKIAKLEDANGKKIRAIMDDHHKKLAPLNAEAAKLDTLLQALDKHEEEQDTTNPQ